MGSSSENPDVSSAVSNSSQIKSFTVLSAASALDFFFSSTMIGCSALISSDFFDDMYADIELSRSACAFMMRSMFADHPYSPVTSAHGELTSCCDTYTFSTLSPSVSLIVLHRPSNSFFTSSNFFFSSSSCSRFRPSFVTHTSFFPSYSFSCCIAYSSIGSTMYSTSRPRFFRPSTNGDVSTTFFDSPVM